MNRCAKQHIPVWIFALLRLFFRVHSCPDGTAYAGTGGLNCQFNACDSATCDVRGAACSTDYCESCDAVWTLYVHINRFDMPPAVPSPLPSPPALSHLAGINPLLISSATLLLAFRSLH